MNKNFGDELETDDDVPGEPDKTPTTAVGNVSFARSVSFRTNMSRSSKGSGSNSRRSLIGDTS